MTTASFKNVPIGTAFPDPASVGQVMWRTDTSKLYLYDGTNWLQIGLCDSTSNLIIPGRILKS